MSLFFGLLPLLVVNSFIDRDEDPLQTSLPPQKLSEGDVCRTGLMMRKV